MEITYNKKVTEIVKYIEVAVAVRYEDEDIPFDAPMRTLDMFMKICDQGSYILYDVNNEIIKKIQNGYVPNNLLPGEYGDYIELKINEDGVITNWLFDANFDDFVNEED